MNLARRPLRSLGFAALLGVARVLGAAETSAVEQPGSAYAAAEEARSAELLGVEVQRVAAFVAGDTETIDRLLATEVAFGHADGRLESKAELLAGFRTGRQRYHAIQAGERRVRLLDVDTGTVAGTAELLVGPSDAPFKLRVRYLAVYQRKLRLGWQLVAYQSTRLPAE